MDEKKILIVEDDNGLRNTLKEFFEAEKFNVLTASNGEDCVEIMRGEDNLDAVLLDIILPKKDGYEVLEEVKTDDKTKNVPIILLTNLGGLSDIEKALGLGATTYLVKGDYQAQEIVEKVKEILK